jgi:hypothetical protein
MVCLLILMERKILNTEHEVLLSPERISISGNKFFGILHINNSRAITQYIKIKLIL